MAPVVNTLTTILAAVALVAEVAEAKPLISPGRHAPPSVANLLSKSRRSLHRALARYYGDAHGLTRPPAWSEKRADTVPAGWSYFGCVPESWQERLLQGSSYYSPSLTPTHCLNQCSKLGYKYGGMEFGEECYCDNEIHGSGGGITGDDKCTMPCAGDSAETCGDNWYLSLYQFNATWACGTSDSGAGAGAGNGGTSNSTLPVIPGGSTTTASDGAVTATGGATGIADPTGTGTTATGTTIGTAIGAVTGNVTATGTATGTASSATTTSLANGSPATTPSTSVSSSTTTSAPSPSATHVDASDESEWYALGCAVDSEDRVLKDYSQQAMKDLTIDGCLSTCEDLGYPFAGVEFGEQCFCGKSLPTTIAYDETKCSMPCTGNATESCGGGYALDLYELISNSTDCSGAGTGSDPTTTATTQIGGGAAAKPTTSAGVSTGKGTGDSSDSATSTATPAHTVTTSSSASSATMTTTSDASTTSADASSTTTSVIVVVPSASASAVPPSGSSPPSSSSDHVVWAHHMVGNTYPYTRDTWAKDISLAQAAGIDGFALNMGSDDWQPSRVNDAYAAAAGTGFKLFLSLDMTSLGCGSMGDAANLVSLVVSHAHDDAQAKHNGQVLVSTFAGSDCHFGQGSTAAWQSGFVDSLQGAHGVDIFFVPSIFSDISTFASNSWMDGELNWNSAWPMGNSDISTNTDLQYINALGGKEYMAAISPFFYTHFSPQTWNKNWLYRGDNWLYATRWEEVISLRSQVKMLEILTWNDYGESSYIGPVEGALPAGSEAWVDGYDHQGLNVLTKYYATAFKTGQYPAIDKDTIVMWSRPHAHDANAPDPIGRPTGWDWTEDFAYAVVLSAGDATVTLTSGSNSETFSIKAGVTKLKIANAPGGMSGTIVRNGATVAQYNGAGFDYTQNPSNYNYNYFVGSS